MILQANVKAMSSPSSFRCYPRWGFTTKVPTRTCYGVLTPIERVPQLGCWRKNEIAKKAARVTSRNSYYDDYEVHHAYTAKQILVAMDLGPRGSYYMRGTGGTHDTCWSDLPDSLDNKIRGRNKKIAGVDYLALDREPSHYEDHGMYAPERWFVRFEDGSYAWSDDLPAGADKVLHSRNCTAVYFGPNGAYLIKHDKGCAYDDLPGSMAEAIEDHYQVSGGITNVAMGPEGEWFIRWGDDGISRNSLHPSLEHLIDMEKGPGYPLRLRLGPRGTYIAVFESCTVWRADSDVSDQILRYAQRSVDEGVAEAAAAAKQLQQLKRQVEELQARNEQVRKVAQKSRDKEVEALVRKIVSDVCKQASMQGQEQGTGAAGKGSGKQAQQQGKAAGMATAAAQKGAQQHGKGAKKGGSTKKN